MGVTVVKKNTSFENVLFFILTMLFVLFYEHGHCYRCLERTSSETNKFIFKEWYEERVSFFKKEQGMK